MRTRAPSDTDTSLSPPTSRREPRRQTATRTDHPGTRSQPACACPGPPPLRRPSHVAPRLFPHGRRRSNGFGPARAYMCHICFHQPAPAATSWYRSGTKESSRLPASSASRTVVEGVPIACSAGRPRACRHRVCRGTDRCRRDAATFRDGARASRRTAATRPMGPFRHLIGGVPLPLFAAHRDKSNPLPVFRFRREFLRPVRCRPRPNGPSCPYFVSSRACRRERGARTVRLGSASAILTPGSIRECHFRSSAELHAEFAFRERRCGGRATVGFPSFGSRPHAGGEL